jgi:hypothetical protein
MAEAKKTGYKETPKGFDYKRLANKSQSGTNEPTSANALRSAYGASPFIAKYFSGLSNPPKNETLSQKNARLHLLSEYLLRLSQKLVREPTPAVQAQAEKAVINRQPPALREHFGNQSGPTLEIKEEISPVGKSAERSTPPTPPKVTDDMPIADLRNIVRGLLGKEQNGKIVPGFVTRKEMLAEVRRRQNTIEANELVPETPAPAPVTPKSTTVPKYSPELVGTPQSLALVDELKNTDGYFVYKPPIGDKVLGIFQPLSEKDYPLGVPEIYGGGEGSDTSVDWKIGEELDRVTKRADDGYTPAQLKKLIAKYSQYYFVDSESGTNPKKRAVIGLFLAEPDNKELDKETKEKIKEVIEDTTVKYGKPDKIRTILNTAVSNGFGFGKALDLRNEVLDAEYSYGNKTYYNLRPDALQKLKGAGKSEAEPDTGIKVLPIRNKAQYEKARAELLEALDTITVPKIGKTADKKAPLKSGKSVVTGRADVIGTIGRTMTFGYGMRKFKGYGEFVANKNYPEVFKALGKFGNLVVPKGWKYEAITLNDGVRAKKHKDGHNSGDSVIIGIGDFTGGDIRVWEANDKDVKTYNLHDQPLMFNGATHFHQTTPFKGKRYTFILHRHKKHGVSKGVNLVGKGEMDDETDDCRYSGGIFA